MFSESDAERAAIAKRLVGKRRQIRVTLATLNLLALSRIVSLMEEDELDAMLTLVNCTETLTAL